jgi:hypothetical protein
MVKAQRSGLEHKGGFRKAMNEKAKELARHRIFAPVTHNSLSYMNTMFCAFQI